MRTTVDIPDGLYRQLKSRAAREGSTVKALVLKSVTEGLGEKRPKRPRRVKLPLIKSKEPGTLVIDNAKIYELIDFP
jgi:hypothetical protein